MVRVRAIWRKVIIYMIILSTSITIMYMLLISKGDMVKTSETAFSVIRVPLKDTLKKEVYKNPSANIKNSLRKNKNEVQKPQMSGGKQKSMAGKERSQESSDRKKVVVQIDKRLLTMIEEIERSDTTKKGKVSVEAPLNFTCPAKPRIVDGVEDLLCMVGAILELRFKCLRLSDFTRNLSIYMR